MGKISLNEKPIEMCCVCSNEAMVPINKKYCEEHWKQRSNQLHELASLFDVKKIICTEETEKYFVSYSSVQEQVGVYCAKILVFNDCENEGLSITAILFPTLDWNKNVAVVFDNGIENTETYYSLFYNVIVDIVKSRGSSRFTVEMIWARDQVIYEDKI